MALNVKQFLVGGLDDNFSYIVYDVASKECVIVDPSGGITKMLEYIDSKPLTMTGVYLTHTHFDHFDALAEVLTQFNNVPVYVHTLGLNAVDTDATLLEIEDQQILQIGEGKLKVLHTPGHIDDAVCFYIDTENAADGTPKVITGDTLFVGGCGRTSIHQVKDLYESLAELRALPAETVVYCGHNYGDTLTSTMGHEIRTNKYYLVNSFNEFQKLRLS